MKNLVRKFAEACVEPLNEAAYKSYWNDPEDFQNCSCLVNITDDIQVEVYAFYKNDTVNFQVTIYHSSDNETPNIDNEIANYLSCKCNLRWKWQEARDDYMHRDIDPGCDPAFPHYGDFERWAYGW